MAMQVKHMLTVGLGLGVAAAFGYHFLSSPQYAAVSENASQLAPLSRFEHASALPVILDSTPSLDLAPSLDSAPVPAQPQVDTQFRSEATPLRSSTFGQAATVEPNTSYKHLVSAAQAALPAEAKTATPQPLGIELEDSDDSFSLDLSSPETSKEPEFVFEEQADVQLTGTLELSPSLAENHQGIIEPTSIEGFGPAAGQRVVEKQTLVGNSAPGIASQRQGGSLAVVVDYNSQPINRSADKGQKSDPTGWKANPFINNKPAATVAAEPALAASELQLPEPVTAGQVSHTAIETKSLPQASSVLSLNDPTHAEMVQAMPATAIAHSIQPVLESQSRLVNNQLAAPATQITPSVLPTMNSADTLKAVHHIEYGKTLSRRGAAYTARQEFLAAMQLIAAANDKATGDNRHSKALRLAMIAIKEAGDFSVASSEQQIHMDVATVVEGHRSNVLTASQAANLSPVQAMNRYFAHAQNQLDLAGGRNVVSAEVFYCMGKLQTVLSRNQKVLGPYETAQSVVYHQAALLSDNQHHRSSNELGVLLARSGRLEQAKLLFERSLMTQPTVRTWQNLAEAHRRLGEVGFANQAAGEVQMLASAQPAAQSNIQWKPINQFNEDAPVEFNEQRVAKLPPAPPKQPSGAPVEKPSIADRIKGIF